MTGKPQDTQGSVQDEERDERSDHKVGNAGARKANQRTAHDDAKIRQDVIRGEDPAGLHMSATPPVTGQEPHAARIGH